jgi:hypothetical protein
VLAGGGDVGGGGAVDEQGVEVVFGESVVESQHPPLAGLLCGVGEELVSSALPVRSCGGVNRGGCHVSSSGAGNVSILGGSIDLGYQVSMWYAA